MTNTNWAPDIRAARAAAREIPEAEGRENYRPIYHSNGKFDAMYCKYCLWKWGTGHYWRDCPLYRKEGE